MLPNFNVMREQLRLIIDNKKEQGHVVEGLLEELDLLPQSYDAMMAFGKNLANLPLRADWVYIEPSELEEIWKECDPNRPLGLIGKIDRVDRAKRVKTAFLSSVCGCILGKPLEIDATLDEIKTGLESIGEWPMNDYISTRLLDALGRNHGSWVETARERIQYVAADDDINYTVIGMLILEEHGVNFTKENVRDLWLQQLPVMTTFGPERIALLKAGMETLEGGNQSLFQDWVTAFQARDEHCGALIRADAYGYACTGRPALAAELAWRDSSWTHRRTGIYGAMFIAAAIAAAQVMDDRLGIFETALQFIPQRSRFYKIVTDSISQVRQSKDWLEAYYRIHNKYKEYNHCRVYQEIGTLINTVNFAENIGHGLCMQVSQGIDADSFGATSGSILGAYFGPDYLDERWLKPFNNKIQTALAWFFEQSLDKIAERMASLPAKTDSELA